MELKDQLKIIESFNNIKEETGNFPWVTRFEVGNISLGGHYSYLNDPRVIDFLGWTPPNELSSVLELASCEGGQTLEIAKSPHVNSIIGLEGKPWLVKRSSMVRDLLGYPLTKASFSVCNFDLDKIKVKANSCFCSGVLYHLAEPWKLIQQLSNACNYLYLATHYSNSKLTLTKNGYKGITTPEPQEGAWTGITPISFWFTLPSLIDCLLDYGWNIVLIRNWSCWNAELDPNPMVGILCSR